MDDFDELIESSSLGTPGASELRSKTPDRVVDRVRDIGRAEREKRVRARAIGNDDEPASLSSAAPSPSRDTTAHPTLDSARRGDVRLIHSASDDDHAESVEQLIRTDISADASVEQMAQESDADARRKVADARADLEALERRASKLIAETTEKLARLEAEADRLDRRVRDANIELKTLEDRAERHQRLHISGGSGMVVATRVGRIVTLGEPYSSDAGAQWGPERLAPAAHSYRELPTTLAVRAFRQTIGDDPVMVGGAFTQLFVQVVPSERVEAEVAEWYKAACRHDFLVPGEFIEHGWQPSHLKATAIRDETHSQTDSAIYLLFKALSRNGLPTQLIVDLLHSKLVR